jgi:membrane-bound metal-dependent hydrolase YbcI (DUF457 family)
MCLGHTHALSGGVTGAAIGEFALRLPPVPVLALAGLTACFAVLPDMDTRGSCAARSLGFLSEGFAWLIGKASGGHRHGTHSILGVAAFTAAAVLAGSCRAYPIGRWSLAVFLTLAIAAGLRALRVHGHVADVAAFGLAGLMVWARQDLGLVAVACAVGCATHIAGDMLTVTGCPLAWPFTLRDFGLPRPVAFVTGTWRENLVLAPALVMALGWLGWHLAVTAH